MCDCVKEGIKEDANGDKECDGSTEVENLLFGTVANGTASLAEQPLGALIVILSPRSGSILILQ